MSSYIGIDIGGTQIRAALFPAEGIKPLKTERIRTYGEGGPLNRLMQLIASILPDDREVKAIGMAAPGPLDPNSGVIIKAPNIPEWNGLAIADILTDHFKIPTHLENDANLAALGEWKFGAGLGHHNLVYLTISTGIGGGVISHDVLLQGSMGLAAEMGHVTILPDGPLCGCGKRGHIEAIASGTGIARYVAEQLADGRAASFSTKTPSAVDISKAAKAGDELAVEAFERAGYYLGLTITNYLHIFNPSIVILGGGVSQAGDLLLKPVRRVVEAEVMTPMYLKDLIITTAALGDDAGLMGALALAQQKSA